MDRYHLAWLLVGKPKGTIRGRSMTAEEEAAYVREVAEQKTAALRASLDAVERQGMPVSRRDRRRGARRPTGEPIRTQLARGRSCRAACGAELPQDPSLSERLADARREAEEHLDHGATGAAPRAHAAVTAEPRVPAVGGTRTVPGPDPIASDYLLRFAPRPARAG